MPKEKAETSTVIGMRIPHDEYKIWIAYCQKANITLSYFLNLTINAFLEMRLLRPIYNSKILEDLRPLREKMSSAISVHTTSNHGQHSNQTKSFSGPQTSQPLKVFTFRIKNTVLNKWDQFRAPFYISRTALIRQAVNYFLFQDLTAFPQPNLFELNRLMKVMYNMITTIGMLNYSQIAAIFEGVDGLLLQKMLDALEDQNLVFRKGLNTYVPGETTLNSMGILSLAELLGRINEEMKTPTYQMEKYEHSSLLRRMFEYFETLLAIEYKKQPSEPQPTDSFSGTFASQQKNLELQADLRTVKTKLSQYLTLEI